MPPIAPQDSLTIEDQQPRDRGDAVYLVPELADLGVLRDQDLRPGEAHRIHHVLQFFLLVIEAHADDLQTPLVMCQVELPDGGKLGYARAAPGGPAINQDYFALQILRADRAT